jgi:hypothetical protein
MIRKNSETSLAAMVKRSVCTVRKKDLTDEIPSLGSADSGGLDRWASALLAEAGPKDLSRESLEAYFSQLPSILPNIGTHGFKLPNPEVTTRPIFAAKPNASPLPKGLISEALLPPGLLYSGDAAKIRFAKFLLARVVLDEEPTRVIDQLLLGENSALAAALIRAGMPTSCCKEIAAAYHEQLGSDLAGTAIHPLGKQIFYEEEGYDDVIILPIASEPMIAEMHRQAQSPGRWLASRKLCAVGGANPVNGGGLCSDLGGAFQLLMAEPPGAADSSLAARMARGGRVYTRYSIRGDSIQTFTRAAPLEQIVGNSEQREKEQAAYGWFAEVLMAPLLAADELVAAGTIAKGEEGAIGAYLKRNRADAIGKAMAQAAAIEVFDLVARTHMGLVRHSADQRIRDVLIEKMTGELL